jgi:hypothetical protein
MFIAAHGTHVVLARPALMLKLSSSSPNRYFHFLEIGYSILPTVDAI